jgi:glycosyltransferase involved in cell wall biosynthesis
MPAKWLARRGWYALSFDEALPYAALKDRGINIDEWFDDNAKGFDLIVNGRSTILDNIGHLCRIRKYAGIPLVMDFDDHYRSVPKYNIASTSHHPMSTSSRITNVQLSVSDACTVSTQYLADLYKDDCRSMTLLPNCVDPEDCGPFPVDPQRKDDSSIRIMFAGGIARYGDLLECKEADEYPNVRLFFMGCFPDWAVKWCKDSRNPRNNRSFSVHWARFPDFRRVLAWGGFDIALAPLEHNDFNLCKSNLKYLDYAMAGIPGIYSSIPTYDNVIHKVTGLLANDTESWYASLKRLIKSEELRRYIAENARDDVLAKYNIEDRIGLWEDAYEKFAALTPNVEAAPWHKQSAYQAQGQAKTDPALVTHS